MGEFELIRRYFDRGPARRAALGIGDDCAILAPPRGMDSLAVSSDMLLVDRHFFADDPPESIGHKCLAVNLSDLAACGAAPLAFTLALALPTPDEAWLDAFSRGLFQIADRFDCELVGGDTTRGPLAISITVFGSVPGDAALRRDRAQPGDDVWVSGTFGGPAWAVQEIRAGRRSGLPVALLDRLTRPQPRVELGLALRHLASAAIDVSDGLLGDLGHIAERSRVGMTLRADSVPVDAPVAALDDPIRLACAWSGGDVYELAFCAAVENRAAIDALSARFGIALTRIGSVEAGEGIRVVDARGLTLGGLPRSHDHFGS
ncbi:MAG: thiamine-phosphate kinase [Burkholderiaceae bacterium]|nr:thiamine-phosphate kinase [Burkholderiaceae bacterium]